MDVTRLTDYFERDARRKKLIEDLRYVQRKNPNATIHIASVLDMLERIEKAPAKQEQEKYSQSS
jgi:hypothetical protein